MARGTRRTGFTGSALIRLLARLSDVDVPDSPHAFAERLSHWLGWTDAISLSTALNGGAATGPAASAGAQAAPSAPASDSAEARDCARVRAALAKAIGDTDPFGADAPHDVTASAPIDFAPLRRHYQTRQQAMDIAITPLRARLRAALTARSPELARLAALDAVMEQALAPRERHLLSTVPGLLQRHFERSRRAAAEAVAATNLATGATEAPAPSTGLWLDLFRHDLQAVLLAELDLRLQPVEGLLDALRGASPQAAVTPAPATSTTSP